MAFASLLGAVGGSAAIIAELPGKRRPDEWSVTVTTEPTRSPRSVAAVVGSAIGIF